MNNNPIILNGLLGSVRTPFPIDGKTAADAATMNGVQQENFAQQNRDALAGLTGVPLPAPQTDQQTQDVPEAAGEAAATATAQATGNPNAAAEAGNAAAAATANAAPIA